MWLFWGGRRSEAEMNVHSEIIHVSQPVASAELEKKK